MRWLDKLRVAIVTDNTDDIAGLMDEMPEFETIEEMKEAQYLIQEAYETVARLQNETRMQMAQVKKNIEFLQSTPPSQSNGRSSSFDVSF